MRFFVPILSAFAQMKFIIAAVTKYNSGNWRKSRDKVHGHGAGQPVLLRYRHRYGGIEAALSRFFKPLRKKRENTVFTPHCIFPAPDTGKLKNIDHVYLPLPFPLPLAALSSSWLGNASIPIFSSSMEITGDSATSMTLRTRYS